MRRIAICILLLFFALPVRAAPDGLEGTFWRPAQSDAPAGTEVRIRNNRPLAVGRCDHTAQLSLMDACSAAELDEFAAFRKRIDSTAMRRDGTHLLLLDSSGATVLALAAIAPSGFEHREFVLKAFRYRGRLVSASVLHDITPQMVFYAGVFSGRAICGSLDGTYVKPDATHLRIVHLFSVITGACLDPHRVEARFGRAFFTDFSGVLKHRETPEGRVILSNAHGAVVLVLRPLAQRP